MPSSHWIRYFAGAFALLGFFAFAAGIWMSKATAEELPWSRQAQNYQAEADRYDDRAPSQRANDGYGSGSAYNNGPEVRRQENYVPPAPSYEEDERYGSGSRREAYRPPADDGYGERYAPPPRRSARRYEQEEYYERYEEPGQPPVDDGYYTQGDISRAGHRFFGSVSSGLASVIEYAFKKQGRPNGYILGEDAGGALVAGLRYGEGKLHTRRFGQRKVYWQGPSIGYDFGAAGSKTMVLVYNLRDPRQIFQRFAGVEGSAYLVGGVSIQFQRVGDVILAPIRSGVGLRLGANIGYLKYTRRPTWNPF